jgi:hypothetical protein
LHYLVGRREFLLHDSVAQVNSHGLRITAGFVQLIRIDDFSPHQDFFHGLAARLPVAGSPQRGVVL